MFELLSFRLADLSLMRVSVEGVFALGPAPLQVWQHFVLLA